MFIFSRDGETVVNSDNIKYFYIEGNTYFNIMADDIVVERYNIRDDAKKELHEIIRQIEAGMTSYQLR